jgi:filamentous hemagglutinin
VAARRVPVHSVKPHWVDAATGSWEGSSPLGSTYAIALPAGTKVYVGPTGAQGDIYVGGRQQIYVPAPWDDAT